MRSPGLPHGADAGDGRADSIGHRHRACHADSDADPIRIADIRPGPTGINRTGVDGDSGIRARHPSLG